VTKKPKPEKAGRARRKEFERFQKGSNSSQFSGRSKKGRTGKYEKKQGWVTLTGASATPSTEQWCKAREPEAGKMLLVGGRKAMGPNNKAHATKIKKLREKN